MHPERYERKICIVFWFCSFTLKTTEKNYNNTLKLKFLTPDYITCKKKSKLNKKIKNCKNALGYGPRLTQKTLGCVKHFRKMFS